MVPVRLPCSRRCPLLTCFGTASCTVDLVCCTSATRRQCAICKGDVYDNETAQRDEVMNQYYHISATECFETMQTAKKAGNLVAFEAQKAERDAAVARAQAYADADEGGHGTGAAGGGNGEDNGGANTHGNGRASDTEGGEEERQEEETEKERETETEKEKARGGLKPQQSGPGLSDFEKDLIKQAEKGRASNFSKTRGDT